jgi:tRNA (cmo5U34)-methyltransferase
VPKSTIDEIRQRFDAEVERFSNLATGQSATIDAPLAMELVAEAAALVTPGAEHVVDVGCGAGNYTLKLLERLQKPVDVTLIDLSRPMLERAVERIRPQTTGRVDAIQGDIRNLALPEECCDIILAAAVLHHLRSDEEWEAVFRNFHAALRPGGALWIFDLVESDIAAVCDLLQRRYGEHLNTFGGEAYRDHVFAYIAKEDTPRSLMFQLDLLRKAGFTAWDVLHKNACFAAFGAVR